MIARVILNNKEHNIDQSFDYLIPVGTEVAAGERVIVPFGFQNRSSSGIVSEILSESPYKNLKKIQKVIDQTPICSKEILELCLWMKEKYFCSFYQALRLFLPPGSEKGIREKKIRVATLLIDSDLALIYAEKMLVGRAKVQGKMLKVLSKNPSIKVSELISLSEGNSTALNSLQKKGYICITEQKVYREAFDKNKYEHTESYVPTEEQKPIIERLKKNITVGKHESILLHGVTGSGKTEVFLQAIQHCIESEKTAIMLVPEISLTPQTVKRFVSRFGDRVAVIHSGLSQGERFDQWNKIKNGEVNVVVGARSAVFAPFENIGIIILDEEHETSYKSDTTPKYHARDIAKKRAEKNGATLLLASATPSLSSFYKARSGEFTLFEMLNRYNKMTLPDVKIVDMRNELFTYKNFSPLSLSLQKEIGKNLENKSKTILFLNRRGYSTFVSCRQCGYVLECDNCSVSMTYHKNSGQMVCHYCGKTVSVPEICPECGSKHIKFFGTGTQKIEENVKEKFPLARVLRMDTDTTSNKGSHEKILNSFEKGEADILIGTQMVTKGLDFPDVTLVGVLAADTSLCMDDFRAGERSFSLLTQVCGRAGRGKIPGRAVIQTYQPFNSIIKYAKNHDYLSFYNSEISSRKRLNYPPFCDIISVTASGTNEEAVSKFINSINCIVREYAKNNSFIYSVTEPAPAPLSKIKGNFRYRILLKADSEKINCLLEELTLKSEKLRNIFLNIDINPTNMF